MFHLNLNLKIILPRIITKVKVRQIKIGHFIVHPHWYSLKIPQIRRCRVNPKVKVVGEGARVTHSQLGKIRNARREVGRPPWAVQLVPQNYGGRGHRGLQVQPKVGRSWKKRLDLEPLRGEG